MVLDPLFIYGLHLQITGAAVATLISMMGTVSNMVLNHIIAGYSNVAVAGMGIAKKFNMLAFAVGQGNSGG